MSYQKDIRKQIFKVKNSSSIKVRIKWTQEEDQQLIDNVSHFGYRWLQVAQNMEQRNASQCCQRWKRIKICQGFQQNKAKRWTQKEDQKLLKIYKEVGPQWNTIAQQMKIKSSKQVRSRFKNFLDPNLNHAPMTEVEDEFIFQEYLMLGTQWTKISEKLPGRSENMIKNRFYSFIKEKYLNQPNPYYKVKPLDKKEVAENQYNFQEQQLIEFKHESQELYDEDLQNDSNEIIDDHLQNLYWNFETKAYIY
ncbi:unnamed protein product [Paramecium pentaurelia]|uniref:Uncharacterized protein n=1 Tax=Paramecium pentaurelia TaxID=43138 RepID=A0A8S1VAN7_9CILI|nr:unnamed protein product [Paramecium pentaurelia]